MIWPQNQDKYPEELKPQIIIRMKHISLLDSVKGSGTKILAPFIY